MNYTNLLKNPEYYIDTIKMIEKSFDYSSKNKFDIDFYPLMQKNNHKNNYILIQDDKIAAHIGVLKRAITINGKEYFIVMYGGIAVDEHFRGKGLFKQLFNKVLSEHKEYALHLLWSDQLEMYQKFQFYPAIGQVEYNHSLDDALGFDPAQLNDLTDKEFEQIKKIYNDQNDIRINRSAQQWDDLKKITSTRLYIKKEGDKISNYFFTGKGEDLDGVIIEIGDFKDIEMIKNYGVVWAPKGFIDLEYENLYAALVKIGDPQIFTDLIKQYTQDSVQVTHIEENEVSFKFENKEFHMKTQDFLTGVLGPGQFEELQACPPLYISGLDSI